MTEQTLAEVDDFLRRLRGVDPDILVWIRDLLRERETAAAQAQAGPSLDVERLVRMARESIRRALQKAEDGEAVERDLWDADATLVVLAARLGVAPEPDE